MFKAIVTVKLRPSILDPEGKAIEHALQANITKQVSGVRVGKEIELFLDVATKAEAESLVQQACEKILSNPVMEDYSFRLEQEG
jgi:phosphoribosylformylglycinamidine synthase subunit PurS